MARFRLRRATAGNEFELLERELESLPGGIPAEDREIERMRNVIAAGRRRVDRLQELLDRAEARMGEGGGRYQQGATGNGPAAPRPRSGGQKRQGHEGARVVAARMLIAGRREDEVEAYLHRVFDLKNARAVVEEARALGAAG
jgi:hypothetical protein